MLQALILLGFSLFTVLISVVDTAAVFSLQTGTQNPLCQPVKRSTLMNRMGPSFNNRYMATDHPQTSPSTADHLSPPSHKNSTLRSRRVRRGQKIDVSMISSPAPWTCQTTELWKNLGSNFFPRYLRSVKCTNSACWFGHFKCRPKIFQVKILKRKQGVCTRVYTAKGQPRFEDYWEMKSQNVALYCECGH